MNKFVGIDYSNGVDSTRVCVLEKRDDEWIVIKTFDNENLFIWWLFGGRCVGVDNPCHKPARDISHIVGRAIDDSWRNKVLHCPDCHEKYHHNGVSDEAIKALQERRAEYLETIGRSDFI